MDLNTNLNNNTILKPKGMVNHLAEIPISWDLDMFQEEEQLFFWFIPKKTIFIEKISLILIIKVDLCPKH